ncbi:MAG: lysylphosphatidylglycerol synthase transmembrane domain-containing protein, partial [Clostridia bacterium]
SLAYIILTVALVVLIGALSDEMPNAWQALKTMELRYVLLAVLCFLGFFLFRTVALYYFIRQQGVVLRFGTALNAAILGQYYSGITPAATGGQPMQVYHLKKNGVPVSVGTSAVGVKFICFQLVLMTVCIVLWTCNPGLAARQIGPSKWLVIFGFVLNLMGVALVVLLMINESIVQVILRLGIRWGARLHLIKDPQRIQCKAMAGIEEFHERVKLLMQRPFLMIMMLFWTLCYILCYMSIVYFLYRAFGLTAMRWDELLTLQLLLYITVSFMPMPGASGAQEGGFYLFFRGAFPEGNLLAALMVWRFFTYYLILIIGAGMIVVNSIRNARRSL